MSLFNAPAIQQNDAASLLAKFQAGLQTGAATLPNGKPILKIAQEGPNAGKFTHGVSQTLLKEGTVIAANPRTFQQGWICWKASRKADEIMVPWGDELPDEESLKDHGPYEDGDGWSIQYSMDLAVVDEPTLQFYYGTNSLGGKKFIHDLVTQMRAQMGVDQRFFVPMFTLYSTNYKSKKGRTVYNPEFIITSWADMNGNLAGSDAPMVTNQRGAAPPAEERSPKTIERSNPFA